MSNRAILLMSGGMILLIALVILAPILPVAAIATLLIGWATFLRNAAMASSINWSAVGLMVLACALFGWILHRTLHWLRAHRKPEASPWPKRWTFALLALVVWMFAAGHGRERLQTHAALLASKPIYAYPGDTMTSVQWQLVRQIGILIGDKARADEMRKSVFATWPIASSGHRITCVIREDAQGLYRDCLIVPLERAKGGTFLYVDHDGKAGQMPMSTLNAYLEL